MVGAGTRWWWCIPVVLSAGCALGTDDNSSTSGALTAEVCGFEVLPSPQTLSSTSPCEQGRTVYGPARFEREPGKPVAESAGFDIETGGAVCVSIRNGEDGDDRISSGSVTLDDEALAVPGDFSQEFGGFDRELELSAGPHELDIWLASAPGAFVEIEVRERFPALDSDVTTISDDGSMELTNVATDHPLLTPNGDGHHDLTAFNADVEPLIALPGKDDGTVDYFLEWEFFLVDLDSCGGVSTGISGTTQVNSPTNIRTQWDGTDGAGNTLPDGSYAYSVEITLVDEFGTVFGTAESPRYGMILDSSPADYDERPTDAGRCDPGPDPYNCVCPGGGTIGTTDPNCSFGSLHPDHADVLTFEDPAAVDTSQFITTTFDATTGRYSVVADLRTYNKGGLVPQSDGVWDDETQLRQWIADISGVPVGNGDSLFNFDYTQLGHSTPVKTEAFPPTTDLAFLASYRAFANVSFNHFFLDAITDQNGDITVDGVTTDVDALLNGAATPASDYLVASPRQDDECTRSGNTNGESTVTTKLCAYNEGIPIGGTVAGVYGLRSTLFDLDLDGVGTTQDDLCVVNGFFACGVRTWRVNADFAEIEASYYVEDDGPQYAFTEAVQATDAAALSVTLNRSGAAGNFDGVCTRGVVLKEGLRVRMDSADGSVPDTCVVNGVFP